METADVYYFPCRIDDPPRKIREVVGHLFDAAGQGLFSSRDAVAIKTHFGEEGNRGHVPPEYVRPIVQKVKAAGGRPFLCDTNTLYSGRRSNAVDHAELAARHGFTPARTGAPVIIADGLFGESGFDVPIEGGILDRASLAREIVIAQGLVSVNHMTGHLAAGYGCALKNLGMGCATRMGKMAQHSAMKPTVDDPRCTGCETCVDACPVGAMEMSGGRARIASDNCIGCGQCVALCRFGAVLFDWNETAENLQKKMVEYAGSVMATKGGRILHFNYLLRITADCDCLSRDERAVCEDFGILASRDPVAIDQASLDLIRNATGRTIMDLTGRPGFGTVQIEYAESRGIGTSRYSLHTLH